MNQKLLDQLDSLARKRCLKLASKIIQAKDEAPKPAWWVDR